MSGADIGKFLTIGELAEKFQISDAKVKKDVRDGKLRAVRFGGVTRFDPEDVRKYVENHRTAVAA